MEPRSACPGSTLAQECSRSSHACSALAMDPKPCKARVQGRGPGPMLNLCLLALPATWILTTARQLFEATAHPCMESGYNPQKQEGICSLIDIAMLICYVAQSLFISKTMESRPVKLRKTRALSSGICAWLFAALFIVSASLAGAQTCPSGATGCSGPVSNWDTSKVTSMKNRKSKYFTNDISKCFNIFQDSKTILSRAQILCTRLYSSTKLTLASNPT